MPQYSIQFDMGFSDLWTFLFGNKICPQCGAKLVRHTAKVGTGPKWQWEGGWLGFNVWYGDRIRARVLYRCDQCRMTYTLTQVRLGLPGEPTTDATDAQLLGPDAQ